MQVEHLVIDGYSLLHRMPEARRHLRDNLLLARQKLLRAIEPVAGHFAPRTTVVFDGRVQAADGSHDHAAVQVLFTGSGQTADHCIEAMVLREGEPHTVLVVTADRAEINTVLAAGGQVMSCREFIELCLRYEGTLARQARRTRRTGNRLGDYFP